MAPFQVADCADQPTAHPTIRPIPHGVVPYPGLARLRRRPPLTSTSSATLPTETGAALPSGLTAMLALACGVIVANLYFAQPLAGPIGARSTHAPGSKRAARAAKLT